MADIRAVRDAGGQGDRAESRTEPKRRRPAAKARSKGPEPEAPGAAAPLGGVRRSEALDGGGRAESQGDQRGARGGAPKRRPRAAATKTRLQVVRDRGLAGLERVAGFRRLGLCAALGALWVLGGCGGGVSGEIGQACVTSGREAASRQLCSCVQGVANQTLSPTEQRRVARFFGNPDEAEAVRASDSARDEAFWDRFSNFTNTAEAICG